MTVYYCKFDYRGWDNLYHKVEAPTQADAIAKMIKGSRIPASKVHVWKGNGLPKHRCGR